MSELMTALIATLSGIAGVIATLAAVRVQLKKDVREEAAADDLEADRILTLKDEHIRELTQKVERLQNDFDALAAKVRVMEKKLDEYGCWNGPKCKNRKPLGGPKPEKTEI